MDDLLATHFAHLFIRDPIVVFAEDLQELDLNSTDHFENLQSTNWQHMRFKPPPPNQNKIAWRVEFRSMEIQMTDFENAAFAIFIVLVTRAILSFDLNLYIPIERTTENMETAHARNAVLEKKFHFRRDPFSPKKPTMASRNASRNPSRSATPVNGMRASNGINHSASNSVNITGITDDSSYMFGPVEDEYTEMTVAEIINGPTSDDDDNDFPGLIPLVESYLDSINVDVETRCELGRYLDLIRKRADGTLWTGAKWIREFVKKHEEYKQDSVVGAGITYDLCRAAEDMAREGAEKSEERIGWEMLGKGRR
jgi:glutamate--cysteine ligase catalytic subunit